MREGEGVENLGDALGDLHQSQADGEVSSFFRSDVDARVENARKLVEHGLGVVHVVGDGQRQATAVCEEQQKRLRVRTAHL